MGAVSPVRGALGHGTPWHDVDGRRVGDYQSTEEMEELACATSCAGPGTSPADVGNRSAAAAAGGVVAGFSIATSAVAEAQLCDNVASV